LGLDGRLAVREQQMDGLNLLSVEESHIPAEMPAIAQALQGHAMIFKQDMANTLKFTPCLSIH
jgi:hypothetical protein